MKIFSDIFFWFGGLLTETLPELTEAILFPGVKDRDAVTVQQQMRELDYVRALGKITSRDYCEQTIALGDMELIFSDLERKIIDLASCRQPIVDIISTIHEEYRCWLIVDYPSDWFRELSTHWNIHSLISKDRLIFSSELNLSRMVPEIFYHLPHQAGRGMDDCIVIDPDTSRAVESMRHGLVSIIYAYPERLKHELALQGILQTDEDVLHPTSSERVIV